MARQARGWDGISDERGGGVKQASAAWLPCSLACLPVRSLVVVWVRVCCLSGVVAVAVLNVTSKYYII